MGAACVTKTRCVALIQGAVGNDQKSFSALYKDELARAGKRPEVCFHDEGTASLALPSARSDAGREAFLTPPRRGLAA